MDNHSEVNPFWLHVNLGSAHKWLWLFFSFLLFFFGSLLSSHIYIKKQVIKFKLKI